MPSFFVYTSRFGWIFLLAAGLLAAYSLQLTEANDYMNYRAFPIGLSYLRSVTVGLLVAGLLMPQKIRKPSDFFLLLYGLFVLVPYAVLHSSRSEVPLIDFALYFFVLAFPLIAMRIAALCTPSVSVPSLINQRIIVWLLSLLCVVGLVYAFAHSPDSAGFDLENSYERRIEGRDTFSPGTLHAYINIAISNGFAPFLAFIAVWRRKALLFVFSLACGVSFYYLLGLKAPFFYIILAALIGNSVRFGKVPDIPAAIYLILSLVFAAFLVEYFLSGFSLTCDYLIRRVFCVPPYVISAYFEFMEASASSHWSIAEGVGRSEPITFLVGESFLGFPGLNANTNTFIYQLTAGGLPFYVLTVALVVLVFSVLDAVYACRKNPALLYLGSLYAILLTEQAATTVLVSSGLGVLIVLNVVSRSVWNRNISSSGRPGKAHLG